MYGDGFLSFFRKEEDNISLYVMNQTFFALKSQHCSVQAKMIYIYVFIYIHTQTYVV